MQELALARASELLKTRIWHLGHLRTPDVSQICARLMVVSMAQQIFATCNFYMLSTALP